MAYSVKQLVKIAGVSARTLHYYDQIGLLKPSFIKENGYRCYEERELLKLQQILFFRELQFSLKDIARMINSSGFNQLEALKDQRKLLELKKERTQGLINTLDNTIKKIEGGVSMTDDDLFKPFKDGKLVEYMDEAKKRWGETEAYRQSMEKVKHWTKEDYARIKKDGEEFTKQLAEAMDKDIKSPEVQALIEKHYQGIKYFYDCPLEMYRNLGNMYIADFRFTAYYDKFKPGLAAWLQRAISYYCDLKQKQS
jgi:DNA-binding transcriptional MerR regulator